MSLFVKKNHHDISPKFYPLLGMVMVSLAVLCTSIHTFAADVKGPAPDFTLASKEGGNVRLQEQLGNVVLINFWASWCGPCREELPYLEELQQEYADLGFTILAVNVDEDPSKADILLNDIPVSFPVLFDVNDEVSKLYDVQAMPTTVIVDRDGNQRLLHHGYKSGDEMKYKQAVKALLRE
ncbi:TlpA family protein disulfide reductase [Paraglaciecola sp. MB-3u-78]|nr:TlpA family protein disulfide reductase [Paraglaciecola sp. MB-3u-78]